MFLLLYRNACLEQICFFLGKLKFFVYLVISEDGYIRFLPLLSLPYLLTDTISRLVLISEPPGWIALYPKIQQAEKVLPGNNVPNLYSFQVPLEISQYAPKDTKIVSQIEYNTLTAFTCLIERGVYAGPHSNMILYKNQLIQPQPDVALKINNFLSFSDPVYLGFALKATVQRSGANQILGVSKKEYEYIIFNRFFKKYGEALSKESKIFLENLVSLDTLEERLFLFRDNLHLFYTFGKYPPINLGKLVHDGQFDPKYKKVFSLLQEKIGILSHVSCTKEPFKGNNFPQKAMELRNNPDIYAIKKDISDIIS